MAAPKNQIEKNLLAIHETEPQLARRICLPVEGDHVRLEPQPMYRIHRKFYPFIPSSAELASSLEAAQDADEVLLFGLGLGQQLQALLTRYPELKILAWERDPWLLRLTLASQDYAARIRSGQLRFLLGSDLLDLPAPSGERVVVEHPFLAVIYRHERPLLDAPAPAKHALLRAGTLFVDDLAKELRTRGYGLYVLDTERLSIEEMAITTQRLQPSLLATINYPNGLAEFCEQQGLALMCWEIDPAVSAPRPLRAPCPSSHVFTYRRQNVARFQQAGFEHVSYLPLAADLEKRAPLELSDEEKTKYGAPISFVGASMLGDAQGLRQQFLSRYGAWRGQDQRGIDEGARLLKEALDIQRQDYSRFVLPELMQARFGDFLDAMKREEPLLDPVQLVAETVASLKRLSYVAALAEEGIVVWGDQGWQCLEQLGVSYAGRHAAHREELSRVYCASVINLDIGRAYQPDIITMRVFDVLACGGFLLAERHEVLSELFQEGVELETYGEIVELKDKVRYYLAHPEQARIIGQRGLRAVVERHSIAQRVQRMLASMALEAGE